MAGLIPQGFIDDLLERSDIVDIVGSRIQLKKSGKNYTALCPFHKEKSPSFSVNQDKQFYYCFGCGAGGNTVQFIMDHDRMEFPETIELLARQHGLDVPHQKTRTSPQRQQQKQSHYELMEQVRGFFQQQLNTAGGQHALSYIQQRKINQNSVTQFELGYAPNTRSDLLRLIGNDNPQTIQALVDTGMLIRNEQGDVYDRFRNRLMVPIRDRRGRVVAFGGRTLGNDKAKYINSPETNIFHKSRELYGLYQMLQQRQEPEFVLVCEGYLDVIALHQHGIFNAVATLGTATNEEHLNVLFRYCPQIIFSFDGDAAGQRAAERAFDILLPQLKDGRRAKFLFLPQDDDPDSLVHRQGKDGFNTFVRQAVSFSDYFFERLLPENTLNHNDIASKAALSKHALPLIQKIPGLAYQQLLLQELQQRTNLDINVLHEMMQTNQTQPQHSNRAPSSPPPTASYQAPPVQRLELSYSQKRMQLTPAKRAISLLMNTPELAHQVTTQQLPQTNDEQTLLTQLIAHIQQHPDHSTHRLLGYWLNSGYSDLLMHLLAKGVELASATESAAKEFYDCIEHLTSQHQKKQQQTQIKNMSQNKRAFISQLDPEQQAHIKQIQEAYKKKPTSN